MKARSVRTAADSPLREFPLTQAQSGIWFAQSIDPANPVFNTGQYVEIDGKLDVAAFEAAVRQLAIKADGLSVRIPGKDVQIVEERNRPLLEVEDMALRRDPMGDALTAMRTDMNGPLDLAKEPLARQMLFRLGPERYVWYQRMHHVVTDGFATALVTQRIAEIYNAAVAGGPKGAELAALHVAVDDEKAYRGSERSGRNAGYWREALRDMPEVTGLKGGLARSASSYDHVESMLAPDICDSLLRLARTTQLSWADLLTALAGAYFARHVRRNEVTIGVPFMGRFGSPAARVPTMLMNILPLRLEVDEEGELVHWLAQAAGRMARDRRHGRHRSEQMRRDLGLLGGQRRLYGPLVNILPFDALPRLSGLETRLTTLGTGPVDDITFTFRGDPTARCLSLEVDTNPVLYEAGETESHAKRLANFVGAAVEAALVGRSLREVATVTDEERCWLIERLNDTAHPVTNRTLLQLLEDSFVSFANRQALRFGGRSLTYAELDRRTAALAEALVERGAVRNAIVAVTLPRSLDLVVALIAILRAGAAYMPLDLSHPRERLDRILASSHPILVLGAEDSGPLGTIEMFSPPAWPTKPQCRALGHTTGESAAYVIYTSGSTGEPKGVVVEHAAIVNRLEWMRQHYDFSCNDVILQKTPMTFDVSVWEFFLAFLCGGSLVIAPPEAHKDPRAIAQIIRDERITTIHFVPSMLSTFLAEPGSRGIAMKRVFCSGEELTADLRDRFHERMAAELHNLYGPTEAAVDVSYWSAAPDDSSRPVPIGYPVWNTRLYVLDDHLRPVPVGVEGHLYLAGIQLARGYLGQKELTAKRFVADPFHPGERMYCTGDLARVRADGAILYLGRSDHQIKLRGLRIELGEIETAILSHPVVTQVVVDLRTDQAGEKRIVAYATLEGGEADNGAENDILAHARRFLPDYMMPSAVVVLDALPVSINGKLDRKQLPAPVFAGGRGHAPATENEKLVAVLFERVLQAEGPFQVDDDFFDLGGHSLLAVELMLHLRETTGHEPGIGVLFEHSTIGRFAKYLDRGAASEGAGLQPLVKLNAAEPGRAPVFMLHPAGGLCWCYNGLARALGADRPAWGVQALALDPDEQAPESLDDMARDYARRIVFIADRQMIHLIGWSIGGILAQAIAVHLIEMGQKVGVVAMLDAYPCDCWRDEPDPGPGAELKALLAIGGHDPDGLPELPLTREAVMTFLAESESPLARLPAATLDGMVRVVALNNRLVRGHRHSRYDGPVLHFRAAEDSTKDQASDGTGLRPETWMPYIGSLDIRDVPLVHAHMTGAEAVLHVAPLLKAALLEHETGRAKGDEL